MSACSHLTPQTERLRVQQLEDAVLPIASTALETGQLETARRLYRRLLDVDDDSVTARMGLGDVAFEEQEPAVAARWYKSAAKRVDGSKDRHSALLALGRANLAAGELDKAHESFAALIGGNGLGAVRANLSALVRGERKGINEQGASSTDIAWARNGIGLTLLLQGDLPGAVAEMEQAVELAPEEERLQANLERARAALGDRRLAAEPPASDLPALEEPAAAEEGSLAGGAVRHSVDQALASAAPESNPGLLVVDAGSLGSADEPDPPAQPPPSIEAAGGDQGGLGEPGEPPVPGLLAEDAGAPGSVDEPDPSAQPPPSIEAADGDQGGLGEPREPPIGADSGSPPEPLGNALGAAEAAEPETASEVAESVAPPQLAELNEPDHATERAEVIDGLDELNASSPAALPTEGAGGAAEAPEGAPPAALPSDEEGGAVDGPPDDPLPGSSAAASAPPLPLRERVLVVNDEGGAFLQFGAFAESANLDATVARLHALTDHSVVVLDAPSPDGSPAWRVRIGPVILRETMLGLIGDLDAAGYEVVNRPAPIGSSGLFTGAANRPLETLVAHEDDERFLQVGAYRKRITAETLAAELRNLTDRAVGIVETEPGRDPLLYRVRIGPLEPDDPLFDSIQPQLQ